jgi:GNAT superfamily N-acetyltransferase
MSKLIFRKAVIEDLPRVLELIGQEDMSPDNPLTNENAAQLFQRILNSRCHDIYLAFDGEAVVGTFALVIVQSLTHGGGCSAVVEDVVVSLSAQGKGVGRKLMEYAAEQARGAGCQKIVLSTGQTRVNAHTFYERIGFERDGYRYKLGLLK